MAARGTRVRRAELGDAEAAAQLMITARRAAIPAILAPVRSDAGIQAWFTEYVLAEQEVWLAIDGLVIEAVLVLTAGWIEQLYVDPAKTNRGHGSMLVDHAKATGDGELQLWTFASNVGAQRFYERHGFVEIERTDGDNEESEPEIKYRWRRNDRLVADLTDEAAAQNFSNPASPMSSTSICPESTLR